MIDLRSDTVTKPSLAMRDAMHAANVGDDVYGDDPSINALETKMADLLGKEAALFVPSGTMGNQLAIMSHTQRGDEVIIGEHAHIKGYEVGAAAVLSGVVFQTVDDSGGMIDPSTVQAAVRGDNIHFPTTRVLLGENAHGSGRVTPLTTMRALEQVAGDNGLAFHLDGARLFNAASHLDVDPREIAATVDSVMVCLSKGLGAPVGSMLVGSQAFIDRARKYRKMLGGGMRQAGVLAAAGLVALDEWHQTICEDHRRARRLAEGLQGIDGVEVDFSRRDINMVFAHFDIDPDTLFARAKDAGFILGGYKGDQLRIVVHRDIDDQAVEQFIAFVEQLFAA